MKTHAMEAGQFVEFMLNPRKYGMKQRMQR